MNNYSFIIDVGGSNIKFYYFIDNHPYLKYSKHTPQSSQSLHALLVDSINKSGYDTCYIGLPGPVYGGEKNIFLPPLGYSLNVLDFLACLPEKTIILENDCSLLHKLVIRGSPNEVYSKSNRSSVYGSICISIGTSFGLSGMTCDGGLVSLEIAHIPVDSILNISGICPQYSRLEFSRTYVREVLNSPMILNCKSGLSKLGIGLKSEADCVRLVNGLIIGSSILAAKLLGIVRYDIYIVTGIYDHIGKLLNSQEMHDYLGHHQEDIQSISIFAQNHLDSLP
ncbi:hypothetical protein [Synechococcus lacustris]|uniref:hypothetical protein n=1 Tax=Synechococcus lacustris TaxID=2116544 RepID=UPI0020CD7DAF|nr:hypothetical protein [Synechococcus lacustris]MCP9812605.1 ROK family protein [Synechococcus lacustris Maggiore-St4-Slac]